MHPASEGPHVAADIHRMEGSMGEGATGPPVIYTGGAAYSSRARERLRVHADPGLLHQEDK